MKNLICRPIGVIRTSMKVKFDAPHQPEDGVHERNVIELFEGSNFEAGLQDLEGFERIWLVWWFDRNTTWRPKVSPPRGSHKRRGVFATRSPHRPCPIGITAVPLIEVRGRSLIVGNVDLVDGTPILDIKPYISEIDSFPNQKAGWLDEEREELRLPAAYVVEEEPLASTQLQYLREKWNIDFYPKCKEILARHPRQSKNFRITHPKDGISRLSCGAWRVFFRVSTPHLVTITRIAPGYPRELLYKPGYEVIPDWKAQREFLTKW